MRTISYRIGDLSKATINIGRVAENESTRVQIDAGEIYAKYPHAAVSLTVQPPAGDAFPAVVSREGDLVIWDVKDSALTDSGEGEIQLTFTADNVVVKSAIGRIQVCRSIVGEGEAPDPLEDFLAEAGAALTAIPETIDAALEEAKESGEFDGEDGFSPTVDVTEITDGHRVTITDKEGAETFDVMNGSKGEPGEPGEPGTPGHSPVLTSSKSGKTTTIYSDGVQLAQIQDGQDGSGADIIDDTAGAGDTDVTFSADKLTTDLNAIKNDLNDMEDDLADIGLSVVSGKLCITFEEVTA